METVICLIPIAWTLGMVYLGYVIGRYGTPVRWVGWRAGGGHDDDADERDW